MQKVPGTEIYIPGFKRDFPGYTLENYKGYLNNPNTGNGIPSGTPQELGTIINGTNTLDLYYRPNRLYMTFNTNGGILAYVHGNNIGFDGDQVVVNTTTGNTEMALGFYDTNVGGITGDYYTILESDRHDFPDINNEAKINLKKLGYSPKNKAEWYTVDSDYNFVKEYKSLGEEYIISAVVHMDETNPHMHLTYIPVVHKINSMTGGKFDKVACSEFWSERLSYGILHDNFHEYMISKGFVLDRGEADGVKFIPVRKLKTLTNYESQKLEFQMTKIQMVETDDIEVLKAEYKKIVHRMNNVARQYAKVKAIIENKSARNNKIMPMLKYNTLFKLF